MRQEFEATLLRIHLNEDDRCEGKPLYEVILKTCKELDISEAIGFRALSGFGSSELIHKGGRLTTPAAAPVVMTIVDTGERIRALQQELDHLIGEGLAVSSPVHVIRLVADGSR